MDTHSGQSEPEKLARLFVRQKKSETHKATTMRNKHFSTHRDAQRKTYMSIHVRKDRTKHEDEEWTVRSLRAKRTHIALPFTYT